MDAERVHPGSTPESRATRRHPPKDLFFLDNAFGGARDLLNQWAEFRGHLFEEPLPLLCRALALAEASRLSCQGENDRVRFGGSALVLKHVGVPRSPFDPAAFGEGRPRREKTERVDCAVSGCDRRSLSPERTSPEAFEHLALQAQKHLESLAEEIFYIRRQLERENLSPKDLPREGEQEGEEKAFQFDVDCSDPAQVLWVWLRDRFPPSHAERRFLLATLPPVLSELLLAEDERGRLKAAALLLSLTRRFASRKWVRTVQGDREAAKGAEPGNLTPSAALLPLSVSTERGPGGEVPADPPVPDTAPT